MKLLFLLLTLLYFSYQSDPSYPSAGYISLGTQTFCPAYVCVTYSGSQLLMEGCLGDWYCSWDSNPSSSEPYQYGKCKLRHLHYKFRKNAFDFCYYNSDCKSNYCVMNKCSVKTSGSTCSHNLECGKGMFCEPVSDTCQQWLTDGQSCSSLASLCKPSSGCVSVSGAQPVCTQYFSVNKDSVTVYGQTFNGDPEDFCVSGSLTSSGFCSSAAYTSASGYPKICTQSTDCVASGDANRYTSCVCFPNTEGVKYCLPFSGDAWDVQLRIKEQITKDFSNCYNYEIYNGENGCGAYDLNKDRNWAPQIKSGTWGTCFDSVNLQVTDTPGVYNNKCPALQCNTGNNEDGNCFHYNEGSHMFYVQSCPSNYICGASEHGDYSLQNSNIRCKYARHRNSLARKGEWCWVDDDCYSGMCDLTKSCIVYGLGTPCNFHKQCDKGLKCYYTASVFKNMCQQWINNGVSCTHETYNLCRPGLVCLATTADVNQGTCQPYYSIESGKAAFIMSSAGSYKSGYDQLCKSGAWDSSNKVCFGQQHKLSQFPRTCKETSDCKSSNSQEGNAYYSECSCFPNTLGQAYCKIFLSDIDPNYYIYYNNYYNQDLSNCYYYEIGNDYGGQCGIANRYIDYWGYSVPSQYFPTCGKDILYDESRYEQNLKDDLIYLYVSGFKFIAYVCFLLGVLLFK